MTAKTCEAASVAATASSFFRSETSYRCKGTFLDSDIECGGEAILRAFISGKTNGKVYFIGCGKWSASDSARMSKRHRFTAIPQRVRESALVKLFAGQPLDPEDDDTQVLVGFSRNHFSNGVQQVGKLVKHNCKASLSLFIPVDPKDLRIVIIPAPGAPHSHPAFPRTKIPLDVQQKYVGVANKVRLSRRTTLGVDQAANEDSGGKLAVTI
ncbi:hypothetical protein R3P38DRAFT_2772225 [Favolaschia claudopus]|uniref:Uncharacterized protein n=1 Tax=Favolaschia claudopus TaxID=2862362 RepID=A0AAW0C5I4_9AGAR